MRILGNLPRNGRNRPKSTEIDPIWSFRTGNRSKSGPWTGSDLPAKRKSRLNWQIWTGTVHFPTVNAVHLGNLGNFTKFPIPVSTDGPRTTSAHQNVKKSQNFTKFPFPMNSSRGNHRKSMKFHEFPGSGLPEIVQICQIRAEIDNSCSDPTKIPVLADLPLN